VDTGSREENASKQEARALSVLIESEPIMLWIVDDMANSARFAMTPLRLRVIEQ
jgi:hypothetical protein